MSSRKRKVVRPQRIVHGTMTLLPPGRDRCHVCAADHPPGWPHNQQSLYYQFLFQAAHGRSATWADALMHCDQPMIDIWTKGLAEQGIVISEEDWMQAGETFRTSTSCAGCGVTVAAYKAAHPDRERVWMRLLDWPASRSVVWKCPECKPALAEGQITGEVSPRCSTKEALHAA